MALNVINPTAGSTRHGVERQSADFPQNGFMVCYSVIYDVDRTDKFQTPFMIAFGHTSDWAKRYVGCADGSDTASAHRFMLSADGDDYFSVNNEIPVAGRIYRHALLHQDLGGGNWNYRFYFDLPNLTKYIDHNRTNSLTWDASTWMVFGAVPYVDFEGIYGRIWNGKVFDIEGTAQEAVDETKGPNVVTSRLSGNVWGRWPFISDANDVSGNGRHLALVSGATSSDVFFDGHTLTFEDQLVGIGVGGELTRRKLGRTL